MSLPRIDDAELDVMEQTESSEPEALRRCSGTESIEDIPPDDQSYFTPSTDDESSWSPWTHTYEPPSKPPPRFRLLDLPLELRDIIYCYSLASGDLKFLRTSQGVNEEASKFIYKLCRFKITVWGAGSNAEFRPARPDLTVIDKVLNIDLCIHVMSLYNVWGISDLSSIINYRGWGKPRQTCRIMLMHPSRIMKSIHPLRLLSMLKRFTGFQTVIIKAITRKSSRDGKRAVLPILLRKYSLIVPAPCSP
ncbi:hypothetical protein MMC28_010112 [Mycoblastus sanguinarius]|nr:hypothetical protein [Mycoblastus sanguinarius]